MAPSRRKGKACVAGGAEREWKVGDLVLAKMKGFPPWPAMVSDPQKWGYSFDRRKLFVFFFGTKQIAFCNYSDVEVFTEEKKRNLLSKRHGKGVDFSRAVDEIIENFENLMKHTVRDGFHSGDDIESPFEETDDSLANDSGELNKHTHLPKSHWDPFKILASLPIDVSQDKEEIHKGLKKEAVVQNQVMSKKSDDDSFDYSTKPTPIDTHSTSSEASTLIRNSISDDIVLHSSNEQDPIELESPVKDPYLNGRLEVRGKAFVRKRRRKSCKKHSDKEAEVSRNEGKTGSTKANSWVLQNDLSPNLISGDEHLPLSKRARVRMVNFPAEKEVNKSEVEILHFSHGSSPSSGDSCRSSQSFSKQSGERISMSSCSILEMEAVLPLSKRLHRALKAMYANEAEANNVILETPNFISVPSSHGLHVDVGSDNSSPTRSTSDRVSPRNKLVKDKNVFFEQTADCFASVDENLLRRVCEMDTGDISNETKNSSKKTMMLGKPAAAEKYFENLVSTLSCTEESIHLATRVAIDCMLHGISDKMQVVEGT